MAAGMNPQEGGHDVMSTIAFDRRQLLARTIWGSLGAAAGLAAFPSKAEADATDSAIYDVACLFNTFTFIAAEGSTDPFSNFRGTTFFVEGDLYPNGTIPVGILDFDPSSAMPIGHWLCRGWFINRTGRPGEADRPEPHVITHQEYVIGRIAASDLFPVHQLTSSGVEGSLGPVPRSVVGGTGSYNAAAGTVIQHTIGANVTGGPNFRFDFRLVKKSL